MEVRRREYEGAVILEVAGEIDLLKRGAQHQLLVCGTQVPAQPVACKHEVSEGLLEAPGGFYSWAGKGVIHLMRNRAFLDDATSHHHIAREDVTSSSCQEQKSTQDSVFECSGL